jgi:hypothetical protein
VLVKGGDMPDSTDAIDVFFDGIFRIFNGYLISFPPLLAASNKF